MPITGKPAELAAEQVKPGMSDLAKGRAFYDYTFSTMKYDKTGTGWGKGDTLVGLRRQARQLHRFPFGVYLHVAFAENSRPF